MAKYAAGARTTAGNTTWPIISIFAEAVTDVSVLECGISNTSSTAFEVRAVRISSGPGTVGAALTKTPTDNPTAVPKALAFTTHTAGTPTMTDLGYRAVIGPYSGYIFTFDPIVLDAAAGTANGMAIVVENGTGQIAQSYFKWSE